MRSEEISRPSRGDEDLRYVMQMLLELSEITRGGKFTMLEYLVSMAAAEASDILHGRRPRTPSTNLGTDWC